MTESTQQPPQQPTPAQPPGPVAELHRQAAADYAGAQGQQGAARDQLAFARIPGNEAAGA